MLRSARTSRSIHHISYFTRPRPPKSEGRGGLFDYKECGQTARPRAGALFTSCQLGRHPRGRSPSLVVVLGRRNQLADGERRGVHPPLGPRVLDPLPPAHGPARSGARRALAGARERPRAHEPLDLAADRRHDGAGLAARRVHAHGLGVRHVRGEAPLAVGSRRRRAAVEAPLAAGRRARGGGHVARRVALGGEPCVGLGLGGRRARRRGVRAGLGREAVHAVGVHQPRDGGRVWRHRGLLGAGGGGRGGGNGLAREEGRVEDLRGGGPRGVGEGEHRGDEVVPLDVRLLHALGRGGHAVGAEALGGDDALEHRVELAGEVGPAVEVVAAREGRALLRRADREEDLHQLVAVEVAVRDLGAAAHALGLSLERGHPDHHLEQHAPHPPLVHLRRVRVVAHQQLRRTVPERHQLPVHYHDVRALLGEPKVAQLGRAVGKDEHVGRLDVLVHDPQRVDVGRRRQHVLSPQFGVPKGQAGLLLLHDSVQVRDGALHHEDAAVLGRPEHLHDVRVPPQRVHDVDLLLHRAQHVPVAHGRRAPVGPRPEVELALGAHDLERDAHPRGEVLGLVHRRKRSLPDHAADLEIRALEYGERRLRGRGGLGARRLVLLGLGRRGGDRIDRLSLHMPALDHFVVMQGGKLLDHVVRAVGCVAHLELAVRVLVVHGVVAVVANCGYEGANGINEGHLPLLEPCTGQRGILRGRSAAHAGGACCGRIDSCLSSLGVCVVLPGCRAVRAC
mmetsp:Transcript_31627/g.77545  ORF Transcript_31627/g.77545 Transcript_31627/m.77545 type:complete len:735 (-) Transcript_31627:41-2245(-)